MKLVQMPNGSVRVEVPNTVRLKADFAAKALGRYGAVVNLDDCYDKTYGARTLTQSYGCTLRQPTDVQRYNRARAGERAAVDELRASCAHLVDEITRWAPGHFRGDPKYRALRAEHGEHSPEVHKHLLTVLARVSA